MPTFIFLFLLHCTFIFTANKYKQRRFRNLYVISQQINVSSKRIPWSIWNLTDARRPRRLIEKERATFYDRCVFVKRSRMYERNKPQVQLPASHH